MTLDCWIYAKPAAWEALATEEAPFSYAHANAITGFWKPHGEHEVYNVIGTQAQIQEILDALGADVAKVFAWGQGTGLDSLDVWPTDPTDILAVMKEHITYDVDGNVTSTTPASIERPNWGHVFLGQKQRIYAGDFSNEFTEEFM